MMLTKQKLNKILRDYRVRVPFELKKELLEQYGIPSLPKTDGP